MLIGRVKLKWKRSVSVDISKVEIVVNNNGTESTVELGPEIQEFMVDVNASTSCSFKIVSWDGEGQVATSEEYTFTLGDLTVPQPATELGHELVAVIDTEVPVGNRQPPRPPVTRGK